MQPSLKCTVVGQKLCDFQCESSCESVIQRKKDELNALKSPHPLVLVEVFYEVLCPDSKDFIIDQVRMHPAMVNRLPITV